MKKIIFWSIFLLLVVFSANAVHGQGFTGAGAGTSSASSRGTRIRQVQTVTVSQARALPDDTLVILTGNIVQSLGRERYTFRDATGDITIEVDRNLWLLLDLTVNPNDRIEIRGEIDIEKRVTEIDVKYLRKL